jgi:acyl-CoA synthetase (AMP-forming)/AMP-acid ligase II
MGGDRRRRNTYVRAPLMLMSSGSYWGQVKSRTSAAPTALSMTANARLAENDSLDSTVRVSTGGGAPPSATLLVRVQDLNMQVTHLCGLTETLGPVAINEWNSLWDTVSHDRKVQHRARQGVGNVVATPCGSSTRVAPTYWPTQPRRWNRSARKRCHDRVLQRRRIDSPSER